MLKALGLGAIVLGGFLLFFGIQEKQSLTSTISEAVTGSPTDHSIIYMAGGAGLAVVGVGLFIFGKKA